MAASFPNAKKTFSQAVNGVTKLVAALFNSNYDEVEAVETFIGPTGGGAQSYSESLVNLNYNYRKGCSVDYKGAADLYVRSGEIMITDASGNKRLRRNTSDTTVAWTDIDTGSEANSTTYYVYACADTNATTFTVKISTSASAPTGMTFYRKIGVFYNNSSGNIEQIGNLNRDSKFGAWESKSNNTVYLALTDGFVTAYSSTVAESGGTIDVVILTDSANPPTTTRVRSSLNIDAGNTKTVSAMCPVKSGEYWKTTGAATVYWLPLS